MNKYKEIRPIVLGIAIKNGKLLVEEGFDNVRNEYFYRCLGGGIEFLENSLEALKREFYEEINAEIKVKDLINVVENIFEYNGKKAHEIAFLYEVDINDSAYKDEYTIIDNAGKFNAKWIDIKEFTDSKKILYPVILLPYLEKKIHKSEACNYIGKTVNVKIDRPIGSCHPDYNDHIYTLNYGYLPDTIGADGEEIDCYILGEHKPIDKYEGKCIAVIHRLNDNDDKLIIAPDGKDFSDNEIKVLTEFQEKYFESEIIR